ncbi:MAG: RNA 2',3'-cyclic phosphodiesterase [Thermoleophilia bacterium]
MFVALDLPATVKQEIADWQHDQLEPVAELRVNHALHITLCFLGSMPTDQIATVVTALQGVRFAPITAVLGKPLFLPPRGTARRVVALTVSDTSGQLSALQAAVAATLAAAGVWQVPKRPFVAHLTVARYRHPGPALALQNVNVAELGLAQMTLYDSVLERDGAVHTPLAVFPASYERSPRG